MIVVLVLFILGGSAYTLICKPWNNGELFKVAIQKYAPAHTLLFECIRNTNM